MNFIFTILILCSVNYKPCWFANIGDAVYEAKVSNKQVLVIFTGSDWCPPCKSLEKYILSSEEFKKYVDNNLVLVKIDFPRKYSLTPKQSAYNHKMQTQYKISGYPTSILLGPKGNRLGEIKSCWVSKGEFLDNLKAYKK